MRRRISPQVGQEGLFSRVSGVAVTRFSVATSRRRNRPRDRGPYLLLTFDTNPDRFVVGIRHYAATTSDRSLTRHARPPDPSHTPERLHARLVYFRADTASFARCAPGQPGLALSRAASPGAPGLDQGRVGHF